MKNTFWNTISLLDIIVNDVVAHRVGQVRVRQQELEGVGQVCVVPLDDWLFISIQFDSVGLPEPHQVGYDACVGHIDGGGLVRLEVCALADLEASALASPMLNPCLEHWRNTWCQILL